MSHPQGAKPSLLKQPKAVWAVAFACVISFMGIGLVDPILPAISASLDASPSQVSLLFTSYLVVTAIAMIGVGWVSSRIGAKWTLILGLALIVIFAGLAGASGTVNEIIGFRGGWGLGNALFIATSLAVIVASASGGFSGAIILYEAALGIGIAAGPLVGGLLGHLSWRGPFYGVSVLMALALVATLLFIPRQPRPAQKMSLGAPLAALGHRGLLTMGIMAFLYNWGFFTMLGYAPYPMGLDALQLGFVFTGWGLLVAAFAVFFAPRLQRRFGTAAVLYANLLGLGIVMIAIALGVDHPAVVITAVIVSGAFIGINNTLTTQAVMLVAPVDRSVASSSYGFVRFIGGGLAPFVAGKIAESAGQSWAFGVGAIAFLIAIPVLASGHKILRRAESATEEAQPASEEAAAAGEAEGSDAGASAQPRRTSLEVLDGREPFPQCTVVAAIDGTSAAAAVVDRAVELARAEEAGVDVVHVSETGVFGDAALSTESAEAARALVGEHVERLRAADVPARGVLLTSVGDHAEAGRTIARHADRVGARTVVVGHSRNGALALLVDADLIGELERAEDRTVVVVGSGA